MKESMRAKLPARILLQTFFRSFALQGSWNFERLQGLGALYTLMPALKYYHRGTERLAAFKRHLGYFNTHPFLATAVLGTAINYEAELVSGTVVAESFDEYRNIIMAPYTAIGDALFWGGVRPLASGVALFLAVGDSYWAPVIFLAIFNLPHFWCRWSGLSQGYHKGLDSIEILQNKRLPDLAVRLKEGTVVLLGGLCAYLMFVELGGKGVSPLWAFGCLPVIALIGWLARKGVSTLVLVWIGVALTTITIEMAF
jgi:mannose/fructose/N-acetylgalactosamine-specific phosphotransferase system component IID